MIDFLRKTTFHRPFEPFVDQLKMALKNEGFVLSDIANFQQTFTDELHIHFKKYKVLIAHIPFLSQQMLMFTPLEGAVLPCNISVIESYPGEVIVIPVNPTELIANKAQHPLLQSLAQEVSRKLGVVIHALEPEQVVSSDLAS